MGEFKHVIKLYIYSFILIIALQMKWKDRSIESHIVNWGYNSNMITYLEKVTQGAYMFIQNLRTHGKDVLDILILKSNLSDESKIMNSNEEKASINSGRLHMEIKRKVEEKNKELKNKVDTIIESPLSPQYSDSDLGKEQ